MTSESKHIERNRKKWDRWAKSLDSNSMRSRFLRDGQRRVVELLELNEGDYFLDIGCGTGWAVRLAAETVNYHGFFYGVDLSEKMIEKANQNFEGKENFHFIKADSRAIPLDGGKFDAIICTHSFHHYIDPQAVVNEIYRLLKPGGKVFVLDPTVDSVFGRVIDIIIRFVQPEHVKMYSTGEFMRFFEAAGLSYIRTETIRSVEKIHVGEKPNTR